MTTTYPSLLGIAPPDECTVCGHITPFTCVITTEDGPRRLHCCSLVCYQDLQRVDAEWRGLQNEWSFAAYAV